MQRLLLSFALAVSVSTGALAQAKPYAIDPEHTWVVFRIDHLGFTQAVGTFGNTRGEVRFDPNDPAKSAVSATIDASTVSTNLPARDAFVKSDKVLDAANHPEIRFTSTNLTKTGEKTGKLEGTLVMRGMSRPVTLDVTFHKAGLNPLTKKQTIGFTGTTEVKRSEFGSTVFQGPIGDTVAITINLEAFDPQS